LPPRTAAIVQAYFGIDGGEPSTLDEIGAMMASLVNAFGKSKTRH
jgi:DNA-directed RNA polymerase sigma subunit (sigma70/sigma32)